MDKLPRRINVFAEDLDRNKIPQTTFVWFIDGEKAGTVTNNSQGSIEIPNDEAIITIEAHYKGKMETVTLDKSITSHIFSFNTRIYPQWKIFLMAHFSAVVGIIFVLLAIILSFSFSKVTSLQHHIILATLSLGGGGFGGEIAGFLKIDLNMGDKLKIVAGGACAIFIILLFKVPAGVA